MRNLLIIIVLLSLSGPPAMAHFQELIPSSDRVGEKTARSVALDLVFTHPMSRGPAMDMATPARFGVIGPTGHEDLLAELESFKVDGKQAFRANYRFKRPGDHIFYLEPAPYWEPAEGRMILHYTKVVVDAFGSGTGWDSLVGFPLEIELLVRPYGLWTGNLFRGVVKKKGQPVPFAQVEVAWRNDGSVVPSPDDYAVQVIKADASGVFSYAMPRSGWWGFAALVEGEEPTSDPQGGTAAVEEGALIWVYTRDL